jgi:hypothetical protein
MSAAFHPLRIESRFAMNLALILQQAAEMAPATAPSTLDLLRAKRSAATAGMRAHKRAKKQEVLATVGGDEDALKSIWLWEPRSYAGKIIARGYEKRFVGPTPREDRQGDDEQHDAPGVRVVASVVSADFAAETTETEYKLVEHVVPRARHPKVEVADAQFEGRFIAPEKHGGASFYSAPVVKYAKATTEYRPLGDFEWADREEHVLALNRANRAKAAEKALRPIRNQEEAV